MRLSSLQRFALPVAAFSRRFVGALEELQQRGFRIVSASNVVVHQQELFELRMVEGRLRANRTLREAGGFRRSVGVKRRSNDVAATGPEACAAHFVRVRLASDRVGSRPVGRLSAGEARHRQIETSPEKMHGADFADKSVAEFLEDLIDPYQDAPEFVHRFRIVSGVNGVVLERNRIGNLTRLRPNLYSYVQLGK